MILMALWFIYIYQDMFSHNIIIMNIQVNLLDLENKKERKTKRKIIYIYYNNKFNKNQKKEVK